MGGVNNDVGEIHVVGELEGEVVVLWKVKPTWSYW